MRPYLMLRWCATVKPIALIEGADVPENVNTPLRPDLLSTMFPLVETIRKMLARVEILWANVGIAPSEAAVLERLFIDHDGQARSGDLLGHPVRSTPALGKVLASLESKGMITRQRGVEDGRVVIVTGTDQARAVYEDTIASILSVVVGPTTADLEDADFAALRELVPRLHPPDARGIR